MESIRLLFILFATVIAGCTSPQGYDVLIKNGTIYNGSGEAPFVGDIAISGDTIAAVGEIIDATAKVTIDAEGLAVAPGFINMLSWANQSLIEDGRSQSDIRQGVTLEVMGEGWSMGPLTDSMKLDMKEDQRDIKYEIEWTTLGEYLQFLEDKGVSTNVTSFVGNGTLREYVIGLENRPATEAELEKMKALLREAMEEGAVGMSSSLLYVPSAYASTEELIELAKVVADYDGMYISHIRNEGDKLLESIEELITIARESGVRAEVYHLKASRQANWHKLDSAIAMINDARAEGLSITADIYTYPASSTGLHVMLPDWVREEGVDATIKRLSDPALRDTILNQIEFSIPPERIMLVGFKNKDLRKHIGKRLSEVAEELEKSPEETMIDLIVEDDSRIQVVYFSMAEENIAKKVAVPWVSFGSDAGSYATEGVFLNQSTHPRAYGTFARVIGKYVRDEKVISLEEAVRKLAALPAENLKLDKRGLLNVGYYSDIVIFNPAKVQDHATFEKPHQYATGMTHVFVNGEQVLKNGEHTGLKPGRFVKGPGYKND